MTLFEDRCLGGDVQLRLLVLTHCHAESRDRRDHLEHFPRRQLDYDVGATARVLGRCVGEAVECRE